MESCFEVAGEVTVEDKPRESNDTLRRSSEDRESPLAQIEQQ
jgi:hypothetical protein